MIHKNLEFDIKSDRPTRFVELVVSVQELGAKKMFGE